MLFFNWVGDTCAELSSEQLQPFKPCWHAAKGFPQGIHGEVKGVLCRSADQIAPNMTISCCVGQFLLKNSTSDEMPPTL